MAHVLNQVRGLDATQRELVYRQADPSTRAALAAVPVIEAVNGVATVRPFVEPAVVDELLLADAAKATPELAEELRIVRETAGIVHSLEGAVRRTIEASRPAWPRAARSAWREESAGGAPAPDGSRRSPTRRRSPTAAERPCAGPGQIRRERRVSGHKPAPRHRRGAGNAAAGRWPPARRHASGLSRRNGT